ncbi:hypothetical protein ATL42_1680 [Sanguibacter antarcticus]|uniref:Uncharacterized protein n=1 Tax=Sanguibacter antarcticus TaxID=372484 RepID=A0A2A9E6I7_9MICO|nr:hypothetical protein ATL42_1680 [Sanguibacter antarcticus]
MNRLKTCFAALGIVASLGLATASVASATASGVPVNGCQGQYWNTAFNSYCSAVTVAANYATTGTCSSQSAVTTGYTYKTSGYVGYLQGGECTYSVSYAQTAIK